MKMYERLSRQIIWQLQKAGLLLLLLRRAAAAILKLMLLKRTLLPFVDCSPIKLLAPEVCCAALS